MAERDATWTPDLRGDESDPLASAVGQAIGTASMCWADVGGAGEFDSAMARRVADGLIAYITGTRYRVPGHNQD